MLRTKGKLVSVVEWDEKKVVTKHRRLLMVVKKKNQLIMPKMWNACCSPALVIFLRATPCQMIPSPSMVNI